MNFCIHLLLLTTVLSLVSCTTDDKANNEPETYNFESILLQVAQEGEESNTLAIELIDIDCQHLRATLNEVYSSDQSVRTNGGDMESVDHKNRQIVISIIEQCGMPSIATVGHRGIKAIFLVLQHSPANIMARYYRAVNQLVLEGALEKKTFALMQDRLLMYHGYKQVYGSQIKDGQLYSLYYPTCVNDRRASIGLGSIEKYVGYFGLDFASEIVRMRLEDNN